MWAEVFGGRGEVILTRTQSGNLLWTYQFGGCLYHIPGGIVTRMLSRNSPRAEGR